MMLHTVDAVISGPTGSGPTSNGPIGTPGADGVTTPPTGATQGAGEGLSRPRSYEPRTRPKSLQDCSSGHAQF